MAKENYTPTIGLEIHAQLNTKTKMFSRSKNDPDETRPNANVSPVDLGHPGTLPVVNKEAVKQVLKVGLAVDGQLADYTEFDRKNYFYPDIPKGYQISQYKYPLVIGGSIAGVKLTRIHLEEDTGRSTHDKGNYSLVDYNRAGVPLMELVTEPVINDAETAAAFAKELQVLLRTLGAGDANMEKGEMRVEANVSVSKTKEFGTKVEVKNLNSFKSVQRAIAFEVDRQTSALESGEEIVQETRGWDEVKQVTFSQRKKESSHDYRYFPDPDIPKFKISEIEEFSRESLSKELPELPWERRDRYVEEYKLKDEDADMYVSNNVYGEFFDELVPLLEDAEHVQTASNYITSDIAGYYGEAGLPKKVSISPGHFAKLIVLIGEGVLSSRGAKEVLKHMLKEDEDPELVAKKKNLIQKSSEEDLTPIVQSLLKEHQSVVEDYKGGKEASLKFLIGQGMKLTGGSANPKTLEELIKRMM